MNIRKLAALDLSFLGPRLILTEFSVGVLGCLALGSLTLVQTQSLGGRLAGIYLLGLGFNYVPLLFHAISIIRSGAASEEIAEELIDQRNTFRKYRTQSLLLLLPFVVPILAILQCSVKIAAIDQESKWWN